MAGGRGAGTIGVVKAWVVLVAAAAAAGCGSDTFECQADDQCGPGGMCETIGFCSFPDSECESGRRYGDFAPPDLRGRCVAADVATSGGSGNAVTSASGSASMSGAMTDSGPMTGNPVSEDGGSSSTGAGPSCDGGLRCYEDAPAGWSGPFRLVVGPAFDPVDACPATDPDQVDLVYNDLAIPGGECGCECQSDYDCGTVPISNPPFTADCDFGVPLPPPFPVDTCIGIVAGTYDPTTGIMIAWQDWVDNLEQPCSVAVPAPPVTPAQWTTAGSVCDDGEDLRCGQGHCLTESGGPICVYTEGDRPCPDGEYSDRSVHYRTIEDTRACNDCNCQPFPGEALCAMEFFDDQVCGALFEFSTSDDGFACYDLTTFPAGFSLNLAQADVCYADDPGMSGEAQAVDPVTFCCAQ